MTEAATTVANAAGFGERLAAAMARADSFVCVGLDPDPARFPAQMRAESGAGAAIGRFNAAIVEATHDLVCAYKPNLGFYLAHGEAGIAALVATRRLIPPDIPVILDAKLGDMATTSAAYARGVFDEWGFDAVTVNPYLGEEALAPFLDRAGRGVFVICKTSNPGGGEVQDLVVRGETRGDQPLHLAVAGRIATWAAGAAATVGLVAGATFPAELAVVRARCPDLPILLPGVGAPGGELEAAVAAGLDATGAGLIVTSSRGVIYAGTGADFAARAREATLALRAAINAVRRDAGEAR
jgi:orotidine-5'-phosphate decarboxylase